ncbi:MAG: adenylate/guanylate cyclase domain-containing protein [Planctomycetales bacterium]|nr:adenylate/guanylate cyclase domain-containing protein [Planctomycetales bacterium]
MNTETFSNLIAAPALLERINDSVFRVVPEADTASPSPQTLERWFTSLFNIQRLAASSPDFTAAAVHALVDPGGLEVGIWMTRQLDGWQVESQHASHIAACSAVFDFELADLACARRETVFRCSTGSKRGCDGSAGERLVSDELAAAQLASPVFNDRNEVVGVLAGIRHQQGNNRRRAIRSLEARWIQLVASALSAGYVRQQRETEATRQRVLLQQVFPQEIVQRLTSQQNVELPAERREITVMFVDMRDSSSLCESLPPDVTYRLLTDVMDLLTSAVMSYGGVVVDYYGDGLIAMWNAPLNQQSHAQMACHAGLEILQNLQTLNTRWNSETRQPIRLGVGIHTGAALVGNAGSRHRIKYGPRGLCVNIANRIERVTRLWPYPILISGQTQAQLAHDAVTQRLGKVRLWGIEQPLELYALHRAHATDCPECPRLASYDHVLRLIETGDLNLAQTELAHLSEQAFDELELAILRQQMALIGTACDSSSMPTKSPTDLVVDLSRLNVEC